MPRETKRQFRMHPQLLFDVIQRQAGSLAKAILEGVMNAVDAGAKKCDIELTEAFVTVDDDGQGFQSREEVTTFFEVFGLPHEAQEGKTFGTFRMGRGQLFAYGENTWETREFTMYVDIKQKGLEYTLQEQDRKMKEGCAILIQLYEKLLPSQLADTEHSLRLWCRWMPIEVFLNKKLISNRTADFDWTHTTDDAYIELDDRQALEIYNLGAHVMSVPKYRFGVGGEVVSRKQLNVNFARNDVQSTCPIWKRIVPLIDQIAKDRNTSKKSLDDPQRNRLATQARRKELTWNEFVRLPLFTAVTGRHFKFWDLGHHNNRVSVAPKGNRLGDRLHRQKVAFVLADETLTRFGFAAVSDLIKWAKEFGGGNADYCRFQCVDFDKLTKGLATRYELLPEDQLRPTEKTWLALIDGVRYGLRLSDEPKQKCYPRIYGDHPSKLSRDRRIVIGLADDADGWTDADTYIALNRRFLSRHSLDVRGFGAVAALYLHECCHRDPDTEDHDHDQAFYELYHDSSFDFVGAFVHKCVATLPQVLAQQQRKLTRKQLRERDRAVKGQRRLEEIEKIAAKE